MVGGIVGGIVGVLLAITAIVVVYCISLKKRKHDVQLAGRAASQEMPPQRQDAAQVFFF